MIIKKKTEVSSRYCYSKTKFMHNRKGKEPSVEHRKSFEQQIHC